MKRYSMIVILASLFLTACSHQEVDTSLGAAAGSGLGYALTDGSPVGTIVGAGAGALIGSKLAK